MIRSRRKKKSGSFGVLFSAIVIILLLFCIWQRVAIMRYAENIRRVLHVPDISSVLHSMRQETFGVLCMKHENIADDCYVFDRDGIVFGPARTVVGDVIVRIDDPSAFIPALGQPMIESDAWANLFPVIRFLHDDGVAFSTVSLKRAQKELAITLPDTGTLIYISLEFSPERSLRALSELAKKTSLAGLKYIDLRAEGKIFYK